MAIAYKPAIVIDIVIVAAVTSCMIVVVEKEKKDISTSHQSFRRRTGARMLLCSSCVRARYMMCLYVSL